MRNDKLVREIYIDVRDERIYTISFDVQPDDILIPEASSNLYVYLGSIKKDKASLDKLINDILSNIPTNRDTIISNTLINTVLTAKNADDFAIILRNKFHQLGEVSLAKKSIVDLFMEIVSVVKLDNEMYGKQKVKAQVRYSKYEMVFYEGRTEIMRHSFPVTEQGLYGLANYLRIMMDSIREEPVEGSHIPRNEKELLHS